MGNSATNRNQSLNRIYINRVQLYGNITKDIELKSTKNGKAVASLTIATNRVWKDESGTKKEDAQFHNCVAWGKTAELINKYLGKGSAIYVEGRLQTRSYEAKDGSKRYVTEVVIDEMQFGPKGKGNSEKKDDGFIGDEDKKPNEDELPF